MKPKRIALALAVIVVSLLVAESLVRWSMEPAFDSDKWLERARASVESLEGGRWNPRPLVETKPVADAAAQEPEAGPTLALHPFYGFEVKRSDSIVSTDVTSFNVPNADRIVDILFLGGSVAASFANETYIQLREQLETMPGWKERGVRIYSAGRGGFRQPQQLHQLQYLLGVGYRPDIVVELDGFNEVALGVQNSRNGVHPIMPSISHWKGVTSSTPQTAIALDSIVAVRDEQRASRRILSGVESWGLHHSAIATRLAQRLLDRSRARFSQATAAYEGELQGHAKRGFVVGPQFERTDDNAIKMSVDLWFRSSLEMDAICRLWNIRYMHLLQPTLHDTGSKPLTETERTQFTLPKGWVLGAKFGYPLLRARGAELAARGVEFHDVSDVFADVEEELYYDVCHFVHAGQEILMKRVIELLDTRPPAAYVPSNKDR